MINIRGSTTIGELMERFPDGRALDLMARLGWPCGHCSARSTEPLSLAAKRHGNPVRAVIECFRALADGGPAAAALEAARAKPRRSPDPRAPGCARPSATAGTAPSPAAALSIPGREPRPTSAAAGALQPALRSGRAGGAGRPAGRTRRPAAPRGWQGSRSASRSRRPPQNTSPSTTKLGTPNTPCAMARSVFSRKRCLTAGSAMRAVRIVNAQGHRQRAQPVHVLGVAPLAPDVGVDRPDRGEVPVERNRQPHSGNG